MSHPIRIEKVPSWMRGNVVYYLYWNDHMYRRQMTGPYITKADAYRAATALKKDPSKLHEGFSDIYILWEEKRSNP